MCWVICNRVKMKLIQLGEKDFFSNKSLLDKLKGLGDFPIPVLESRMTRSIVINKFRLHTSKDGTL